MSEVNRLRQDSIRLMGIDPGSQVAGFAVLEAPKKAVYLAQDFKILDAGALKPGRELSLSERLGQLHEALFTIAQRWQPDACAIEKAFVGVNSGSALKLGEARGALMCAVRRLGVPIFEVTPTQVKKTVTGVGHAQKKQVSEALRLLLKFQQGSLPYDVSDALAVALCLGLCYHETRAVSGLQVYPLRKSTHDALR